MSEAADWGLTVSVSKTKGMVVGQSMNVNNMSPVQVDGGTLEIVNQFTYLCAEICRYGEVITDVTTRIAKAARDFGCLRKPVLL